MTIIATQNGLTNGEAVTPHNIGNLPPDGYLDGTQRHIPFEFLCIPNKFSDEYAAMEQLIADNGGTAVGLIFEIAATPQKVELVNVWWEIGNICEGLEVGLTLVDINGDEIEPIVGGNPLTFADDPCEVDTFCKYRFDNAADAGKIGRGNSAILQLEILAEPEGGLLGTNCADGCEPYLIGGLQYDGFCIQRNIIATDLNISECLDCATQDVIDAYEESPRGNGEKSAKKAEAKEAEAE